jgi:uncharacterized protein YdeI (YjbR/CyaY-like superfamily)
VPAFDDAPLVQPGSREEWRAWLEANHASARSVWLVMGRSKPGRPSPLGYEAAVEEALCFGWVDSRGGKLDDERTRLYFAPRKPRSGWAAPNKERIERLLATGLMAPAGIAAVEAAKQNGSWTLLDGATRGELPDDLRAALDAQPPAREHWDAFPRSVRRAALEWVAVARKAETRERRIAQIAERARENVRPNEQRPET